MNAIGHTHVRFKRAGVGTKGILQYESRTKNAHRTNRCVQRRSALRWRLLLLLLRMCRCRPSHSTHQPFSTRRCPVFSCVSHKPLMRCNWGSSSIKSSLHRCCCCCCCCTARRRSTTRCGHCSRWHLSSSSQAGVKVAHGLINAEIEPRSSPHLQRKLVVASIRIQQLADKLVLHLFPAFWWCGRHEKWRLRKWTPKRRVVPVPTPPNLLTRLSLDTMHPRGVLLDHMHVDSKPSNRHAIRSIASSSTNGLRKNQHHRIR
jgi:hypothetical protein